MEQPWLYEYRGPLKKRKRKSPQQRALDERKRAGKKFAHPATTRTRVLHICALLVGKEWKGKQSVYELAVTWDLSVSRIEQLVAEARRQCNG